MLQAPLRLPTTEEFRAFLKGYFNPTTGVKKPFEVVYQSCFWVLLFLSKGVTFFPRRLA